MTHRVRVISRNNSIIVAVAGVAVLAVSSCSGWGKCGPRDASEAEPLAHAKPLCDDGCIAGLPFRGEEGEERLARDAERGWTAKAPRGRLLDLIHEGDEVLMEGTKGVVLIFN